MAGVTISSSARSGQQAVAGRLASLARAVERTRGRRQWDVRQIMLVAGSTAMALGFVAIVLGWYGAAHSTYLFQEMPYLISGGLLGVALVAGGGFLFFAAWLVRMIEENRRHARRVADTLDRLDRTLLALGSDPGAASGLLGGAGNGLDATPPPPPPPPAPSGGGWSTTGGSSGGWA